MFYLTTLPVAQTIKKQNEVTKQINNYEAPGISTVIDLHQIIHSKTLNISLDPFKEERNYCEMRMNQALIMNGDAKRHSGNVLYLHPGDIPFESWHSYRLY
jgi:hypothetical protein